MKISKAQLIILRGSKCEICGLNSWLGKKITFDEHHKDGNRKNNVEENRMILCPNCHRLEHLTRSEEFKKKCSNSAKGNSYCKGRNLSEEHKEKLREINTGVIFTDERKRKIGSKRKGCYHSEESKRKISESMRKYWMKSRFDSE